MRRRIATTHTARPASAVARVTGRLPDCVAVGWRHALAVPLTDPDLDADPAASSYKRTLVIPVLSLAVIGVAFVASSYAALVSLTAPLIHARLRR